MREDFNKLLTERERFGSKHTYGAYRNVKRFQSDDEFTAGREGMKHRGRDKSFNENLNPLRGFIHANVGRPWDKVYSEICANFDKRKVINAHILEHLFQYVEREIYIIDGKPCTMNKYSYRRGSLGEYEPIAGQRYVEWYVDPRDGLLKVNKHRLSKAAQTAKNAADTLARQKTAYRRIDDDNHLILKDGTWWHYIAKNIPPKVVEFHMPADWKSLCPADASMYTQGRLWEAVDKKEKEKIGKKVMVDPYLSDKIDIPEVPGFTSHSYWYRGSVGNTIIPKTKYFYERKTASHKQLKVAGVDGMVPEGEVKRMSHREASKYRPKKA